MSVKIAAAMPKGEHNGLAGQEDRIEGLEGSLVPIVVLAEVAEVGRVTATDEQVVKLRIAEIEIVGSEAAKDLLRTSRKERTGVEELDFEGLEGGEESE